MIYGSVCSGIEAATVAWHPLGWRPAFFSEIETFPRAVLAHHYPETPLHGDFTTIQAGQYESIDLLVGGTPCQSFSVAGLRGGLDDDRGNLALEYLRLAQRLQPTWLVWENVPGVLSSGCGRDFGSILGGMAELGYGFAYRILDAQHFGVPQRRRRVFVVGYFGDWRPAAAVLFERHSLSGHPAPRREARKDVAGTVRASAARRGSVQDECGDGGLIAAPHAHVSPAIKARDSKGVSSDGDGDGAILVPMVAHALRGNAFNASEDGTGRGTPLVQVAFNGRMDPVHGPVTGALDTDPLTQCVAIQAGALRKNPASGSLRIAKTMQVRRLTPTECERLQGFPDGWTDVPYRGKPAADGPRYKALGNSMAVPCMAWIGLRIQSTADLINAIRRAA